MKHDELDTLINTRSNLLVVSGDLISKANDESVRGYITCSDGLLDEAKAIHAAVRILDKLINIKLHKS